MKPVIAFRQDFNIENSRIMIAIIGRKKRAPFGIIELHMFMLLPLEPFKDTGQICALLNTTKSTPEAFPTLIKLSLKINFNIVVNS